MAEEPPTSKNKSLCKGRILSGLPKVVAGYPVKICHSERSEKSRFFEILRSLMANAKSFFFVAHDPIT
ncbi:MAG: hypothetical protein ACOZFS_00955 [Thermodesulfobacteriota bacterium]